MVEEFLCRGECLRLPAFMADQKFQRFAPKCRRPQRTPLMLKVSCAPTPTDPQTRMLHSFYSLHTTEYETLTSGEVPNSRRPAELCH
jgi:hypothetical protein